MNTTKLFEMALGLTAPWQVTSAEFRPATTTARGQLALRIATSSRVDSQRTRPITKQV